MGSNHGISDLGKKGQMLLSAKSKWRFFCRWSNRGLRSIRWSSECSYHRASETQKRSLCRRSPMLLLRDSTIAAGTWTRFSSAKHLVQQTVLKICISLFARGRNPEQLQTAGSLGQLKMKLLDVALVVTTRTLVWQWKMAETLMIAL